MHRQHTTNRPHVFALGAPGADTCNAHRVAQRLCLPFTCSCLPVSSAISNRLYLLLRCRRGSCTSGTCCLHTAQTALLSSETCWSCQASCPAGDEIKISSPKDNSTPVPLRHVHSCSLWHRGESLIWKMHPAIIACARAPISYRLTGLGPE